MCEERPRQELPRSNTGPSPADTICSNILIVSLRKGSTVARSAERGELPNRDAALLEKRYRPAINAKNALVLGIDTQVPIESRQEVADSNSSV